MNTIFLGLIFFALIVIIAFLFIKTDIGGSIADSASGCVSSGLLVIIFIGSAIFVIHGCKERAYRKAWLNAQVSQGKIHQEQFKTVSFVNSQYKPYKTGMLGGIFGDYPAEFSASISGHQKLPQCLFTVTFIDGIQSVTCSDRYDDGWTDGQTKNLILDQKLTFKPTRIRATISFPNSNFVITETFVVDSQGNLRSQGLVRRLQKYDDILGKIRLEML